MDIALTWLDFLLSFGVVTLGSLVQGTAGFGLALLVGPLLVMIDPVFLPGPVVLIVGLLTVLMAFRDSKSVNRQNVQKTVLGYVLGTAGALALLSSLPPRETALLLGGLILAAVGSSAAGIRVEPTRGVLFSAGIMGGFMGTISGVGLPPVAIALQNESGPGLRGTLAWIGILYISMAALGLAVVGQLGVRELFLGLCLSPGVIAGYLLAGRATRFIDRGMLRPAVFLISGISAVALIVRNV
ncbi:MAG TPA: sulfite exporter TauE/SafE family protein [Desulfomicrobiaceae bacterium]|nr:sulfite exporter TauE/SafE family protein [Desulfomicrobiaceae bacterium]